MHDIVHVHVHADVGRSLALFDCEMERWESNSWGGYPATYAGASHVRYPAAQLVADDQHGQSGARGNQVFTSASGHGAHAWTSPSNSQQSDPADDDLLTFSRESPFSQREDDPQV